MKKLSLLALCTLALAAFAAADDWPQWRGPNRDDVSKETGLLKTWKEAPPLLWTFREAGEGYSGPAIVGDTLYMMGASKGREEIYAIDLKTRQEKWSTPIGPQHEDGWANGPRGTPAVDGDLVYGIGGQGDLICVKADGGDKVWFKDFKKDLGGDAMGGWGFPESPLVDGDLCICSPGGKNGTLAAFNKKTGELVWRTKEWTDKASYASAVAADIGGVHQYVQLTENAVAGVDAKEGKVLWKYERHGGTAVIPTPIVSDGHVFITSGYGAGCSLIQVTKGADKFEVKEIQKNKNMDNKHGGVVLVDGYLYGFNGDGSRGQLECLDFKNTDVVWKQEFKQDNMFSVTCADGRLYCYGQNAGTVLLVDVSAKGYKEEGSFTIPEQTKLKRGKNNQGHIWTHPVVANGKLYLRDQDLLFCYDVKAP